MRAFLCIALPNGCGSRMTRCAVLALEFIRPTRCHGGYQGRGDAMMAVLRERLRLKQTSSG